VIARKFPALILFALTLILLSAGFTACQTTMTAAPLTQTSTTAELATAAPASSTPDSISPSPTPPQTIDQMGITEPNIVKAFSGTTFKQETDGSYSVQATSYAENATKDGFDQKSEKYTIDKTTFNIHADMNNAYAPATVNATNAEGKQVTLIWNEKLGWVEKFNASTDIESPTDFPYEARIPMLQSILLDHADPFIKRSNGFTISSENTSNGRVVYLRTDDASKRTDYWLRVIMLDGSSQYINPVDINDLDGRKIMMCGYPKEYTNPTGGQNPGLDKGLRAMLIAHLKLIDSINGPIWGILQADDSFLNKFAFRSTNMPGADGSDLKKLLNLFKPTQLSVGNFDYLSFRTHFTNPDDKNTPIETGIKGFNADGTVSPIPVPSSIQEQIIPCSPQ
jgi:hypothetical protein